MKIKSKNAFTLVELLVAIVIIAASFTIVSTIKPQGQTAKREADKLQAQLESVFAKAERMRTKCTLYFYQDVNRNDFSEIFVYWNTEGTSEDIRATEGCKYRCNKSLYKAGNGNYKAEIEYGLKDDTSDFCSIGIKGADSSYFYIRLSETGRLSQDINPKDWSKWGWGKEW